MRHSIDEVGLEFQAALRAAGLVVDDPPLMDGLRHRVPVEGDRAGKRSGSYRAFLDGWPAGHIHNFRTGNKSNWKFSRGGEGLDATALRRARAETARQRLERLAEQQALQLRRARYVRAQLARGAYRIASWDHPYLVSKHLRGGPRPLRDAHGNLIVLAQDLDGQLWTLQRIAADGQKRFIKDSRTQGVFHLIKGRGGTFDPAEPLVLVEGWATGATIAMLLNVPVVVCFSADNLEPVARAFRARYPQLPLVIAGDNDHQTARKLDARGNPLPNVGQVAALAAAAAVAGVVALPDFAPQDPGSDWNDRHAIAGTPMVRRELSAFLRQARAPTSPVTDC